MVIIPYFNLYTKFVNVKVLSHYIIPKNTILLHNFLDNLPDLDTDWQIPSAQPDKYTRSRSPTPCITDVIEISDDESSRPCAADVNVVSSSESEGNMYQFDDPICIDFDNADVQQDGNGGKNLRIT